MKKISRLNILLVIVCQVSSCIWSDDAGFNKLSDGIRYKAIYVKNQPWVIHVVEADLSNSNVLIQVIKAGNRFADKELTSAMSDREALQGKKVIAAVNGDYFNMSTGVPVGLQVSQGEIVSRTGQWSTFGLSTSKKPYIEVFTLQTKLLAKNHNILEIDKINKKPKKDGSSLLNQFFGSSIDSLQADSKIVLRPLKQKRAINDSIPVIVTDIWGDSTNSSVDKNRWVIAANGKDAEAISNGVVVGDTLVLFIGLTSIKDKLEEAVSGGPRIVRNGRISVEWQVEKTAEKHATTRHPRTAVGISRDSTKVYLVTVDGRQPGYSVGMTLYELAEFMIDLGCYHALNLDGGGSTTMVINGKVVNKPSDQTGERPVTNALLVIRRWKKQ